MIWKLKYNGSFVDMPTPSGYTIESNDLDDESYRSVVNGSVVRQLVSRQWQKMNFTFAFKSESDCASLIDMINANTTVEIMCKSPVMATSGWVTLVGYVSAFNVEMVNTGNKVVNNGVAESEKGYTLTFSFVEGYRS